MAESEDKSKNATTGDQPATKRSLNAIAGDQPATIDSLGFEPYVIAIADFLTDPNTKPPLTLSIEGEWGSGKSSFMKQLEQEIQKKSEERNNYKSFTTWFKVRQGKFITLQLIKYFKLRFKPKTQTVWFNAWRHDKAEALWAAFALSFLDQISTNRSLSDIIPNSFGYLKLFSSRLNQKGKIFHITQFIATSSLVASIIIAIPILYFQVSPDKISQWSEDIVCMLEGESSEANNTSQNKQTNNQQHNNDCSEKPKNPILTWLLLIGGFGGSFTGIAKLFTKLKDIVGDPKMDLTQYLESPDYDKQIAFIEKFHDDFSKIVDAYAGKDEKVYVFIDDLDRCELGKSADLLQALNLMISNDPNIIFILGMDRKKVAATITYQQKDILPYLDSISEKNGKSKEERNDTSMKELDYGFSFMEKFIQLSFEVPKPSEPTLDKFFEEIFVNNDNESKKENSNNQKSGVADFVYDFYLLAITKLLNDRYFRLFSFYFHTLIQQRQKSLIPFILKLVRHTVARLLEKMKKEQETERKPHESENRREIDSIIKQELSDFYPIIGKDLSPDIEYRLLKMGANFFDYNPRRLKQYINLVRLHTYILYYAVGVPKDEERSLYIEQLGKFIAIILKYPRLRNELKEDSTLLKKLEKSVINEEQGQINEWINSYPDLKKILCYFSNDNSIPTSEEEKKFYVLEGLDTQKLLQVSPRVSKLRSLLLAERWDEADMETLNIMLRVAKRIDQRWFRKEDLKNFPCEVLYAISQIWDECSKDEEGNSRYGFLVQKEKYLALNGKKRCDIETWIKFSGAVGRSEDPGDRTKLGHYPFHMYGDMGDWEGTVGTLALKLMLALKPIFGISFEPVVGHLLCRLDYCEQELKTRDSIGNEDTRLD